MFTSSGKCVGRTAAGFPPTNLIIFTSPLAAAAAALTADASRGARTVFNGTGYHSLDGDEGIRNKKKCDLGYFRPRTAPLRYPLNPARSARPLVDQRGDVQAPQMPSGGVALTVAG